MKMSLSQWAITVIAAVSLSYTPATAQVALQVAPASIETDSAQQRINYSGKLRMLSQRIPAAACHYLRGVDVEASRTLLVGATVEFEKILAALEYGDPDLAIYGAESGRKSLARIEAVKDQWSPFRAAAEAIAQGTASDEDIGYVMENNLSVLMQAQLLVEELSSYYTNPNAAPRAVLMLIDIAGRQRMLTQKMSKETCLAEAGLNDQDVREDLANTMNIFEASLEALRFGLPQVGIRPPPSQEISEGLESVLEDWNTARPYVAAVVDGGALENAENTDKFHRLNVTMSNMNRVVGLYAAASTSGG